MKRADLTPLDYPLETREEARKAWGYAESLMGVGTGKPEMRVLVSDEDFAEFVTQRVPEENTLVMHPHGVVGMSGKAGQSVIAPVRLAVPYTRSTERSNWTRDLRLWSQLRIDSD